MLFGNLRSADRKAFETKLLDHLSRKMTLTALENESEYGMVLRAKGIVAGEGCWYHFDYTPGEADIREGSASITGRLCVIGSGISEGRLDELFA